MSTENKDKLPIIGVEQFMDYYNNHNYEDNMFIDGHINPDYNSFKKTGLIAKILEDHFEDFYEINKDLGTIMLRATFSNKNNKLIPNDFVRVILTSNYKTVVTLVPQDAVLENVNSKYVWVIDENNTAKQKDIKVNGQFEKSWIVTEGLQPGDVVISTNLQSIRSGSKVQVVESEKTEDIKTNNAESEDNEQITTNKENTK